MKIWDWLSVNNKKRNKDVLFDRIFCLIYQTFFEKKTCLKIFFDHSPSPPIFPSFEITVLPTSIASPVMTVKFSFFCAFLKKNLFQRISVGILLFVLLIRSNELYATNRISIFLLPISATQKQWVNLQAKHGWLWLGFDLLKLNYATFFFIKNSFRIWWFNPFQSMEVLYLNFIPIKKIFHYIKVPCISMYIRLR